MTTLIALVERLATALLTLLLLGGVMAAIFLAGWVGDCLYDRWRGRGR